MALIGTSEAARRLGITPMRVGVLIREGRLKAQLVGRSYVLEEKDLAAVADRPTGRPPAKKPAPKK